MPLTPGTRLWPYEILEPIGAGSMGDVYKARDTRLDRIVAIKKLKNEHSARFQQEARAIAALNHPHICTLYDVGRDYLVMEFVDGNPVKGPLPAEEAVRLAVQVASALEEAHSRGILHRYPMTEWYEFEERPGLLPAESARGNTLVVTK